MFPSWGTEIALTHTSARNLARKAKPCPPSQLSGQDLASLKADNCSVLPCCARALYMDRQSKQSIIIQHNAKLEDITLESTLCQHRLRVVASYRTLTQSVYCSISSLTSQSYNHIPSLSQSFSQLQNIHEDILLGTTVGRACTGAIGFHCRCCFHRCQIGIYTALLLFIFTAQPRRWPLSCSVV